MKTILASLFAASLLATIADADVVIYRGVNKVIADAQVAALFNNKNPSIYLLVDFEAGQAATILFGRIGGARTFSATTPSDFRFNSVLFPNGKFDSIITTGNAINNGPADFNFGIKLFRGANTNLLIRKTPAHTLASRPNVLKGTIIEATSAQRYIEQHMGLTFQGAATIKANDANQTIDQVLADLVAGLMGKGFVSL